MRVLIYIAKQFPGESAAAELVSLFARALRKKGNQVRVVAIGTTPDDVAGRDQYGTETILVGKRKHGRRSLARIMQGVRVPKRLSAALESQIKAWAPDVVLCYGQSWFNLHRPVKICAAHNTPIVANVTETWPFAVGRLWSSLDNYFFRKFVLPRLDGVVAISSFLADQAAAVAIPSVIVPALGEEAPPELPPLPKGAPLILTYVGYLMRRDQPLELIQGIRLALEQGINVKLVLVGNVRAHAIGRDVCRLVENDERLSEHVEITGWVSDEELRRRWGESHAFAILRTDDDSAKACFPFRLSKFLLAGRAVILTNTGDAASLFEHRESAWLLPTEDPAMALADALKCLAEDRETLERIGRGGQKVAIERLAFTRHSDSLNDFLLSVSKDAG